MKNLILILGCLVTFNASAWTGGCVKMDYAEVKDMSDKDLSIRYCRQQEAADSKDRMAEIDKPLALSSVGTTADRAEYSAALKEASECRTVADQVKRVVESRKLVIDCSSDFWHGD